MTEVRVSKRGVPNDWRPLKYKSVEELEQKVSEYFDYAKKEKKPLTLEWLGCFLDFNLISLRRYEVDENNMFCKTIRKAKAIILVDKVERLSSKEWFTPWLIFDLTNNYWDLYKNRQEIDSRTEFSWTVGLVNISSMSPIERLEYIKNKCK